MLRSDRRKRQREQRQFVLLLNFVAFIVFFTTPCENVLITHADGSRVSIAIIRPFDFVCDSVILSVCLSAR